METLSIIGRTIAEEFSDIPDAAQFTRVFVRLFMAAFLGGVLGYEREYKGKAAGLRTHMLVALGSALFVIIPLSAGMQISDLSRVLQGLVAGIGFLGTGAIIKGSSEHDAKGLTSAASVWLTAAIGVSAGMGRESLAVLTTLMALLILAVLPKLPGFVEMPKKGKRSVAQ